MARPRSSGALLVCLAIALCAVVRLPSVRWDAISDDEGIYDAMGVVLNQGGLMYREAVDHKPPGLAYTYAWTSRLRGLDATPSQRIAAVHLLGALVAAGTALGLYVLGRRLLPTRAQLWPPLLFALSSTAKVPFDGLAVNGELLMGLPSIWALVLVEWGGRLRRHERALCDVVAGALLSVAILYKWQAGLLALPMAYLGLVTRERFGSSWWLRALAWTVGSSAVLAGVAYAFWCRHGLSDAISWGLLFNRRYLASGTHGAFWWRRFAQGLLGAALPSWPLYVFGTAVAARWLRAPKARGPHASVACWAVLALTAVALGGRFFGHYFLQAELPLCLLAADPISARWQARARPRWLALSLIAPWFVFSCLASSPSRALHLLNPNDPNWRAVGQSIAAHAQPDDNLFVWGNAPLLYHFSGLPMATRFSFCNYLTGISPATPSEREAAGEGDRKAIASNAQKLLLDDFRDRRPTLVFDSAAGGVKGYGRYPLSGQSALFAVIRREYKVISSSASGTLYARIVPDGRAVFVP